MHPTYDYIFNELVLNAIDKDLGSKKNDKLRTLFFYFQIYQTLDSDPLIDLALEALVERHITDMLPGVEFIFKPNLYCAYSNTTSSAHRWHSETKTGLFQQLMDYLYA